MVIKIPAIPDNQPKVKTLGWPQQNEDNWIKEKKSKSSWSFVLGNSYEKLGVYVIRGVCK